MFHATPEGSKHSKNGWGWKDAAYVMFKDVEARKKAVGIVLGRKGPGHKRAFEIENCAVDREFNLEALTHPD